MGIVAVEAFFALYEGLVFKPHAVGFPADILMAFETKFVS